MPTIYHRFEINAPINTVFEAVSLPAIYINWWPLKCDGQPTIGSQYNFNFGEEYDWYAEVCSLTYNQSIHFKMKVAMTEWMPTTFGFVLIENENSTFVDFEHKDWEDTHEEYRSASYCWAHLLSTLKQYLEKGVIVPFEQRS
jgi:uncharacterized protein YndB with AHSA1/START domain